MSRFEHHEHYLRKSVVFFLNHSGNEVLDRGTTSHVFQSPPSLLPEVIVALLFKCIGDLCECPIQFRPLRIGFAA